MEETNRLTALLPDLAAYVARLQREPAEMAPDRLRRLRRLADYLQHGEDRSGPTMLHFICTHNSRRSQIAQVWAATAAALHDRDEVEARSGGTEATAFHPSAVAALRRAGFRIEAGQGPNPTYRVHVAEGVPPLRCFSKTYTEAIDGNRPFAAIMTCAEADAACPFIPGAAFRLALPYDDPGAADGRSDAAERYDETVRRIGGELLWAFDRAFSTNSQTN